MDTNKATDTKVPDANKPLDPLRRVFVPIEKKMLNDNWTFKTLDKERYYRTSAGVILRVAPKINGKRAKKDRQKRRQQEKTNAI